LQTKEIKLSKTFDSKAIAVFIQHVVTYKSNVIIKKENKLANAKSLLGLLSLGLIKDCTMVLEVQGQDEDIAIEKISQYLVEIT